MGTREDAANHIRTMAREGDVINLDPVHPTLINGIGSFFIRWAQRSLFGKTSNWRDSHSMIYFRNASILKYIGEESKVKDIMAKSLAVSPKEVFSVAPPQASFIPIEDFSMDKVSVYRYTKRPLTPEDIGIMLEATVPLLLTSYDYLQLLNIALNQVLDYPFKQKTKLFDFSPKMKVCSVGVAAVYLHWRKRLQKTPGAQIPERLFSTLNPSRWPNPEIVKEFRKDGHGWSVESTYPAQFANSNFFADEFELVLRMENGQVIS